MLILLIAGICFAFLVFCSGLFVFPAFRQRIRVVGLIGVRGIASRSSAALSSTYASTSKPLFFISGVLFRFLQRCRKSPGLVSFVSMVLMAPPLVAVLLSQDRVPEYQDSGYRADSRITELLKGEQLVPPMALPPDVFTTREVELIRPALASASRNWELLDADFKQRLLHIFKIMREQYGYEMTLLEGYRSPERQASLQASGAGVVTNAGAYQSYHQYGLAGDCAFFREGKLVISERDPWAMRGYELYGEVAESVGLTWGGRWKLMDFGHVELRRSGVLGKRM